MTDEATTSTSEMFAVGQRADARAYCAGSDGNISVRLPGDQILITASGARLGRLTSDELCQVDLHDATCTAGKRSPSSEFAVHLAIYRKRPDVNAVIHTHAPYGVLWSCMGREVPGGIYAEAEVLLGDVPVVPYRVPGSSALAEAVAGDLQPDTAALLTANHGPVTFGDSLDQAMDRMEMLESYLRLVSELTRLGEWSGFTEEQIAELKHLRENHLSER